MATKILLVDNDLEFANDVVESFARFGCEVTVCGEPRSAVEFAGANRPDIIIVAVELTQISGFTICSRMKRDATLKDRPLILLSSAGAEQSLERHSRLRTRADSYACKPLSAADLFAHARQYIHYFSNSNHARTAKLGTVVDGKWRIVRLIAEDWTGEVFEAVTIGTGEKRAIRILHPHLEFGSNTIAKFAQGVEDAQVLSRGQGLNHPSIARVFEEGHLGSGWPYCVMEELRGCSLLEYLYIQNGRPVSEFRAAQIVDDILQGLGAVSKIGRVRPTLAPQQVMITPEGPTEYATKLYDLGLASVADVVDSVWGTFLPESSKAEQTLGSATWRALSDVVASQDHSESYLLLLSMVFYKLLTGQDSSPGASLIEIAKSFFESRPRLPSEIDPELVHWDLFFAKAFSRDSGNRFATPEEMATALRAVLQGRGYELKARAVFQLATDENAPNQAEESGLSADDAARPCSGGEEADTAMCGNPLQAALVPQTDCPPTRESAYRSTLVSEQLKPILADKTVVQHCDSSLEVAEASVRGHEVEDGPAPTVRFSNTQIADGSTSNETQVQDAGIDPEVLACSNCGDNNPDPGRSCSQCHLRSAPRQVIDKTSTEDLAEVQWRRADEMPRRMRSGCCRNCGTQSDGAICPKCGFSISKPPVFRKPTTLVGLSDAKPGDTLAGRHPTSTTSVLPARTDILSSASDNAAVIVLSSPEPGLVGRRFPVQGQSVRIGRDSGCEICVESDNSVSNEHCEFARTDGLVYLVDIGSTNGTFVGDIPIVRQALCAGDILRVGQTILKYIDGNGAEEAFHAAIDQLLVRDPLTSLENARAFSDELRHWINRALADASPLCIILFGVDSYTELADAYGGTVGNTVIIEASRILGDYVPVQGRLFRSGNSTFAMILPDMSRWDSIKLARSAVDATSGRTVTTSGERIPLTISAGVAMLREPWTFDSLLDEASRELANAMRTGNIVVPRELGAIKERTAQRILEGPWVVRRALGAETPLALAAFEIDDESTIVETCGPSGLNETFQDLVNNVGCHIDSTDLIGTWQNRYVIVAFNSPDAISSGLRKAFGKKRDSEARIAHTVRLITESWTNKPIETAKGKIEKCLRVARMTSIELTKFRESALDELVLRLLQKPLSSKSVRIETRLPHPIAITRMLVETRANAVAKFSALTWAIEVAIQFLVALQFCSLRDCAKTDRRRLAELTSTFVHSHLTGGRWFDLAKTLAPMCNQADLPELVAEICRRFSPPSGKSAALHSIERAMFTRNTDRHGPGKHHEFYTEDEAILRNALDDMTEVLRPLDATRLVSVESIEGFGDDDRYIYVLRDHRGPYEHFAIARESLSSRLQKDWCYLLHGNGEKPLLLAPFFAALPCSVCQRLEVLGPRRIVLGPKGRVVEVRGVSSSHVVKAELPWTGEMKSIYELVESIREKEQFTPGSEDDLVVHP